MPSAPSRTAFATSVASARVGLGARIIDSSICVATIAGVDAARAARSRSFWRSGISSIGSSTPRSPRATITTSVTRRIVVDLLHRGLRLDLRHDRHRAVPISARSSLMSCGPRTNDCATRSTPRSSARGESLPVALGDRRQAETFGGDVHPLAGADRAAAHAFGPHRVAVDLRHRQLDGSVRQQDAVAGPHVARQIRVRRRRALLVRLRRRGAARTPAPARASADRGAGCRAAPSDRGDRPSRRSLRRSSPRRPGPARRPVRGRRETRGRS